MRPAQHMTTQDTTTTAPQLQTFLVNIDQVESIKRGIATPHSTAKIELDLATLTSQEREWIAARYSKGELKRHPDRAGTLTAPCPRPQCLLEAIRAAMAQDAAEAAQKAKNAEERHAAYRAEIAAADADPLRLVYVVNVGHRDKWVDIDDAIAQGWWDNNGARCEEPRNPYSYPERVRPETLAAAKNAAARICAGIDAKVKAKREAEYAERLARLQPHLNELERAKHERGLLDLRDAESRLDQAALDDALIALGDDHVVTEGWDGSRATAASDEQFALLLAVEEALGKAAVDHLASYSRVNVLLTTADGRKLKACVSKPEPETKDEDAE